MASRLTKSSAAAALCISLVGGAEGLRQNAYPDPATQGPPWTVCYGHTVGVLPGDHYTVTQCKEMLVRDLEKYATGIEKCISAPMTDEREVAMISFAYNVGVGAACNSSVVKLINAGRTRDGCNALLKWNRAAGIVFPGLTRRRERERAFCLLGVK